MTRPREILLLALAGILGARLASAAPLDHTSVAPPKVPNKTAADVFYRSLPTDNNLVHVTITNYGFIGNNYFTRSPSFEYPFGTGFEHMVRGGLWVGARSTAFSDTEFTRVTTGAVDGFTGSSAQSSTEYTPRSPAIINRSALENSSVFDPHAISEQDYISEYDDLSPPAGGTDEPHRPLGIAVRQETYSWSFGDFKNFIILHFILKNLGPPLRDVWMGFYAEMATGPKNAYSTWPPTAAGGGGLGGWFQKKLVGYDIPSRLFREHYCQAGNAPPNCTCSLGAQLVPEYAGIKLLGISPGSLDDPTKHVTMAAWNFEPGSTLRDQDIERYPLMSAGTVTDLCTPEFQPGGSGPPDPVELLAAGPFSQVGFGDSVSVDFALIGAPDRNGLVDLDRYADLAQRAFDLNYVVPKPPPSPIFHAVPRDQAVDFYWDDSPEATVDSTSAAIKDFEGYRLYLSDDPSDLDASPPRHLVAQFDLKAPPHDTTGFNTGLDSARIVRVVGRDTLHYVVIDGDTCQYRHTVTGLRNGFKYYAAVTSYDLGDTRIESLESGPNQNRTEAIPSPGPGESAGGGKVVVFPNPYRVEARWDQRQLVRDHYLWFTNLPERCTIRIYTLAGDLVFETDFDGSTYQGEGVRGVFNPASGAKPPVLSGRSYPWDLITRSDQAAATGLYLYSVEDKASGKRTVGKFLIIKSDRENF